MDECGEGRRMSRSEKRGRYLQFPVQCSYVISNVLATSVALLGSRRHWKKRFALHRHRSRHTEGAPKGVNFRELSIFSLNGVWRVRMLPVICLVDEINGILPSRESSLHVRPVSVETARRVGQTLSRDSGLFKTAYGTRRRWDRITMVRQEHHRARPRRPESSPMIPGPMHPEERQALRQAC